MDGNGRRQLSQVTEEDARTTASGDKQVTRTTSSSDVNGNFQIVQREVADTTKSSPETQETKTTLYQADGNGGSLSCDRRTNSKRPTPTTLSK